MQSSLLLQLLSWLWTPFRRSKQSSLMGVCLESMQSTFLVLLRSSYSQRWPMTAMWPSENLCTIGHHEPQAVPPPAWGGLDWRISPHNHYPLYSLAALLWPQCHRPLHVWLVPFVKACLHGHSHPWSLCCCQQWVHLPVKLPPPVGLLCGHLCSLKNYSLERRGKAFLHGCLASQ